MLIVIMNLLVMWKMVAYVVCDLYDTVKSEYDTVDNKRKHSAKVAWSGLCDLKPDRYVAFCLNQ